MRGFFVFGGDSKRSAFLDVLCDDAWLPRRTILQTCSRPKELDIEISSASERTEILWIRCDDAIPVARQQYERSIDHIILLRAGEELTRRAAEGGVQPADVEHLECSG